MTTTATKRYLSVQPVALTAGSTSGSVALDAGLECGYVAVINATEAQIYLTPLRTSTLPTDALPFPPDYDLALPIPTSQRFTLFWTSAAALSANQTVIILFSNEPIPLTGGPTTTGGVASSVVVTNTVTAIISQMPDVVVTTLPMITGSNYSSTSPASNPIKVDSSGNQYVNFASTQPVNVENNTQLQNGITGASQVSVTTTAAQLTIPDSIRSLAIQNTSTTAILYLGASDTVSATTGYPVQPMQTLTFDIDPTASGLVFWAIGSADLTAAILGVS